jgi:hypothetical protein
MFCEWELLNLLCLIGVDDVVFGLMNYMNGVLWWYYVVCFMFGVFLLVGNTVMVVKLEEFWRIKEFDFLVFRMDIFVVYIYII